MGKIVNMYDYNKKLKKNMEKKKNKSLNYGIFNKSYSK